MIVPMARLTLLCSAASREAALGALRELGCVHVTLDVRDGEGIRRSAARVAAAEQALRILDVAEKGGTFVFKPDAASPVSAMGYAALLAAARKDLKPTASAVNQAAEVVTRLREEILGYQLQLKRFEPFGKLTPASVAALAAEGICVKLFKIPAADAATLGSEAFIFSTEAGFTYGAWISADALPAACEAIALPELSTEEMLTRLSDAADAADLLVAQIAEAAEALRPELKTELLGAGADKRLEEVSANLRTDGDIAYLLGYIPKRATDALLAKAAEAGWGVVLDEPEAGDPNVPVLLEPPRGFRAIGNLFKGLGILPGYTEGDCSVPFYLFFSLFFAMLVGDAGYGAVMLAGTLAAGWKFRKNVAAKPVILIMTVFCLATIVWGILSGTYFGIAKEALPSVLSGIPTVAWLGQDANIMFLCFLIGACHISVARLWNAVLLAPSIKAVGEIGWLGVTWSMFMIVCGIVVSWFTQPVWCWWFLGGSVGLILVSLCSDIKNEGVNIGMLPLNVISAMGDIISYVRLFAVGLASVKVAENFNSMALGLELPMVLRILAVSAILLVGHGLNLAMGALSVLVHAVRLNTLEFSNAKGITWSGLPYLPFKHPQQ